MEDLHEKSKRQIRKRRLMEERLREATSEFPKTFYNEIYSIKVPASQTFIEALRQKGVFF